jgi:hypothetical protein
MVGKCQLCTNITELRNSHIIPKFVFDWLRETSPGQIRVAHTPNQRIQDGLKVYLLCDDCEGLFSKWEKPFQETIFSPLHALDFDEPVQIHYKEWAVKYAVSVTWRVLSFYKINNELGHLSEKQRNLADEALNTWRSFLRGQVPNTGIFEQHIIPISMVAEHNMPGMSHYLNRYFLRTVDMDVACSSYSAFVYVKMGRLILFGLIQEPHPKVWLGTKLHIRKGIIGGKRFILPTGIDEYINYKASKLEGANNRLSRRQQEKVRQVQEMEKFKESEIYQVMVQDMILSSWDSPDETEEKT